jgi:hypothetical protein
LSRVPSASQDAGAAAVAGGAWVVVADVVVTMAGDVVTDAAIVVGLTASVVAGDEVGLAVTDANDVVRGNASVVVGAADSANDVAARSDDVLEQAATSSADTTKAIELWCFTVSVVLPNCLSGVLVLRQKFGETVVAIDALVGAPSQRTIRVGIRLRQKRDEPSSHWLATLAEVVRRAVDEHCSVQVTELLVVGENLLVVVSNSLPDRAELLRSELRHPMLGDACH